MRDCLWMDAFILTRLLNAALQWSNCGDQVETFTFVAIFRQETDKVAPGPAIPTNQPKTGEAGGSPIGHDTVKDQTSENRLGKLRMLLRNDQLNLLLMTQ